MFVDVLLTIRRMVKQYAYVYVCWGNDDSLCLVVWKGNYIRNTGEMLSKFPQKKKKISHKEVLFKTHTLKGIIFCMLERDVTDYYHHKKLMTYNYKKESNRNPMNITLN